jgi:hypothetical protein
MLLFYVCKLFFYTRNLSFYICKLEEVWNSNVLIYIGQARWSQIVHTITSPLPFASPQNKHNSGMHYIGRNSVRATLGTESVCECAVEWGEEGWVIRVEG